MRDEACYALVEHRELQQVREEVYSTALELRPPAQLEVIEVEPIEGGYGITVDDAVPPDFLFRLFRLCFPATAATNSL